MIYPKRFALGALLVFPCLAQTSAELLQKAIYTQETAGDSEGAIQIYRQITAAAAQQSPVAAEAQFRIAELLLQKGDLNGAATEFNILASRYSDHQALIAKMAGRIRGVQDRPSGAIHDGRYRDSRTGLEFPVPAGWKMTYNTPTDSDNGNMVGFSDGSPVDFGVWMRPEVSTAAEIPEKLRGVVAAKAKANVYRSAFAFRPESIGNRTVAGQQAVSATADYVENGRKLAAYYTWIYTTKAHVMFVARDVPEADLSTAQLHLDVLIASAIVP
jgi:hypothetical protein